MHYDYQIFCPSGTRTPASRQPRKEDVALLFEAYSCVLFEAIRRFSARATPLRPWRSGVLLSFDTDIPWYDVEMRMSQIVAKWNARPCGVALAARRAEEALLPG